MSGHIKTNKSMFIYITEFITNLTIIGTKPEIHCT